MVRGVLVKTGIYCPYCAAELFDPEADRCVSCGMFVAPELRAALAAKVPLAVVVPPLLPVPVQLPQAMLTTGMIPETVPVAAIYVPPPELGRPWHESSFNEAQQIAAVWQTILFQSSLGLAIWGWAIIPLGRLGYLPYAWFPAGLAIIAGLLGLAGSKRWKSLGIILAAMAAVVISGFYS